MHGGCVSVLIGFSTLSVRSLWIFQERTALNTSRLTDTVCDPLHSHGPRSLRHRRNGKTRASTSEPNPTEYTCTLEA